MYDAAAAPSPEAGTPPERWASVAGYEAIGSDALVETYDQMTALSRAAHSQSLAILTVLDERKVHEADGAIDMASWAAMRVAIHPPRARAEVEVARGLLGLPQLAERADAGECSMDQLRPGVRLALADKGPDADARWADLVPGASPAHLDALARRLAPHDDPEDSDPHADRYLRWRHHGRDCLGISGRLPIDMGLAVAHAISAIAGEAPRLPEGGYDSFPARCADALLECTTAGLVDRPTATPKATVVLHVGADALRQHPAPGTTTSTAGNGTGAPTGRPASDSPASDSPASDSPASDSPASDSPASDSPASDSPASDSPASEACAYDPALHFAQTAEGVILAPEVARRLACDARLAVVLETGTGEPLGIGRTSRVVPGWLETLVNHRDEGHCRFPGCERTRGTQCHHIVHWADGGPTDLTNLATLCSRHHHLVHEGGFRFGGDPAAPGGLWVRRADGTPVAPVRTRLADEVRDRFLGEPGSGSPALGGP